MCYNQDMELKDMKLKDYFNIPNLLSYIRLIMLPVFLLMYRRATDTSDYVRAFAVLGVAMFTDALDGYIARKFNMITQWGKIIDPVSDKLLQGILAIAVMGNYPPMKLFVIIFAVKEIYMSIMNLWLVRYDPEIVRARLFGKIVTVLIDVAVGLLLIFTKVPSVYVWIIAAVLSAAVVYVGARYSIMHWQIIKDNNLLKGKK
ncbi:MAG: CDP-alcohol phosphatidyltransferase family protein [Erysipelotrichaceae bacterium]|nr:CDP-alcohol phosphatidyltransferase family protein [Erysipelotrichaceae bacterium]